MGPTIITLRLGFTRDRIVYGPGAARGITGRAHGVLGNDHV